MSRECYRCGGEIEDPVEQHAHYVIGEDTVGETVKEKAAEKRHNDYTRAIRERLMEVHGLNATQANNVLARNDEDYLKNQMSHNVDDAAFEEKETVKPSSPEEEPEVIRVDSKTEEVTEQRTGLVHQDCAHDDDEIIW